MKHLEILGKDSREASLSRDMDLSDWPVNSHYGVTGAMR
jgi:hypothetical protein